MATHMQAITDNLDLWTSALLTKSTAGRGSNGRVEAYGIKKLRELILELAILGKLVEQDSNEDSALELLRQVKRAVRPIVTDAKQNVPSGWVSVPLACVIASNIGGGTPSKQNSSYWNGGISWASVKDIQSDKYLTATIDSITEEGLKASSSNLIPPGRLLVVTRMGLGKLAINNIPVAINQDLRAIEPNEALNLDFAYLLFKALKLIGKGVTVKGITVEELHSMIIALPPLAEQHRIVAKVDELMALCDQLEQQQTHSIEAHQTLVETLLGTLTTPVRPEPVEGRISSQPFTLRQAQDERLEGNSSGRTEFAEAWTRIADHFDTLFTTEQSIDQLKQTILQLAVMGKLVPQDPNDEPASVLVRRIHKDNQTKEPKYVVVNDLLFDLPTGWTVTKLGSILNPLRGISYGVIKLGAEPEDGGIYILRCSNVRFREIDLTGIRRITEELSAEYGRTILEGGEILVNVRGTLGGCAVVPQSMRGFNIAREVAVVPVHEELDAGFLLNVVAAPYFQNKVNESLRGIAYEGLNLGLLREFLVPIPPLAEQHRIVAKVDELMALCDTLKARFTAAQTTQIHLADTIVEQAVA